MASVNPVNLVDIHGFAGLDFLVAEVDKLVSLPDIYYRLEEVIVDPSSTTDSIAGLLRADPDLCARMLRMANSAFYSFPTKIETIERAVSTIGLRQIRELVLVTAVIKAFEGIPPGTVNMSTFWEHSVAVGIMAREIGQHAGIPNAGGFYIPGLLHDLGRLVMYLKLPGLMHDLLNQRAISGQLMYLLEQNILNYTHADIGGRLLEFWKLPQSIWEPVVKHHDPHNAGEFSAAACSIHIADAWVNANRMGSSGAEFELVMDAFALDQIGVDIEVVEQAGRLADQQTHTLVRQFLSH
ncbi:MAG: HDOD domain-containing protein [Gammaproteobacteria bacterium]|nr:HDOD domain-containing protein [Gammaproteobacteria bacterium]